jgi:hypothetical protein
MRRDPYAAGCGDPAATSRASLTLIPLRKLTLDAGGRLQRRDSPYEVPLPRLPFLDRESVANVQGLGSLLTCVLNAELAGFPPKSWNDSRTRWRSPWILPGLPIEGSADRTLPLGRTVADPYAWIFLYGKSLAVERISESNAQWRRCRLPPPNPRSRR